jgi:N-methylhydantoinase A
MAYAVAVDIGGTFTDLVAYDYDTGAVAYSKSPTTYGNFVEGILACFDKAKVLPRNVSLVSHGTTLVINAIIQRHGANAALLTTKGFRDLIEIARGNRADPFDLHYRRDEPLIPRDLRFEIAERIDATGEVQQPLDSAVLPELAQRLKALDVESVAISFLNSYLNPEHEQQAAERLQQLLPDTFITTGTELSQEWFEYERSSTAVANAYVGPQVISYVRRLQSDLTSQGFAGSLFMMGSNGGVLSVERTVRQPVALVESGPIGGCIGASSYAAALELNNVIAFDMGGTTAKCALVESGSFTVDSVYYAGGYTRGFPIKTPVISIVEVGSGGGSLARLDRKGQLHVGPESAGSTPGPVCYGRGGTEPTVTDANLVLGRLSPTNFLGGELVLDRAAAARSIGTIAERLGLPGEAGLIHIADGIIAIATVIMAGAIRRISIEHGHDPRDFVLFSYGGGGPLHASALARELSIPTVIIPPEPGNFSAIGMLLADARLDQSRTFVRLLDDQTVAEMDTTFGEIEQATRGALAQDFGAVEFRFERHAEMRYRGQRSNIKVAVGGLADRAALRHAFERDYLRRFGQVNEAGQVEFQVLHVSGFASLRRPEIARLPRPAVAAAAPATRQVYFGKSLGMRAAQVLQRASLAPGATGQGPAVIEEYGSTTLVWPDDRFEIGPLHELRLHCGGATGDGS